MYPALPSNEGRGMGAQSLPIAVHQQSPEIIELSDEELDNAAPRDPRSAQQDTQVHQLLPLPQPQNGDHHHHQPGMHLWFRSNSSHNIIRAPAENDPRSNDHRRICPQYFSSAAYHPAPAIMILSPDGRRVLSAPAFEYVF